MKKKCSFVVVLLGSIFTLVYSWNQNKPSQSSPRMRTSHVTRTPASQAPLSVKGHTDSHLLHKVKVKPQDEIKSVNQMSTSLILLKNNYHVFRTNIKRQTITQVQLINKKPVTSTGESSKS